MHLKDLIERLKKTRPGKMVRLGFDTPHSWRGNYYELAFVPRQNVLVGTMLKAAESALGATYCGWKGGDYTMHEYSDCYLAEQGECGEELGPTLLEYMLKDEVKKKKAKVSDGAPRG